MQIPKRILPAIVFSQFAGTALWFAGNAIIGDSQQYSAIIALSVPRKLVGSGLILVNSIGFAITILSLWFVNQFIDVIDYNLLFLILAIGPIAGLFSMKPLLTTKATINNLN